MDTGPGHGGDFAGKKMPDSPQLLGPVRFEPLSPKAKFWLGFVVIVLAVAIIAAACLGVFGAGVLTAMFGCFSFGFGFGTMRRAWRGGYDKQFNSPSKT